MVSKVDIGAKIRLLREGRNLTVGDIAEASEKSVDLVYKWERGEREPGVEELQRIAQRAGVKVAFLFGESENDLPTPRQALDVLTELVETAEAQERQLSQFRAVVRELAGEDPESWSDAVKAVMGGGTHPSPHSARSGEVKSSEVGDRFHGRRRGREDRAESDTAGQNQ